MMYDVIYLYNQFIGPLPDTYSEFVKLWHACFPLTMDTKVLARKADVFSKTVLGTMFEKCQRDKKFVNLLKLNFDLANGFTNYEGTNLLSHYHEAAYDAYMTGYCYAMILKFGEVDEAHAQVRKNRNSKQPKGGKGKKTDNPERHRNPQDLHGTPLNLEHRFFRENKNKVMMFQYAVSGPACYHMDPEKPDRGALDLEEQNKDVLHVQFQEGKCSDLTAQNIAYMFSDFGDFHVVKDTKDSAILNFYYMD